MAGMREPEAASVIVHSLDQALAAAGVAAALDVALVLASAPGAGSYVGAGWFAALRQAVIERYPAARLDFVLDCADEPGSVMAALRRGLRRVRFDGAAAAAAKLEAMGVEIDRSAGPALDLRGLADPEGACRKWLAAMANAR